jgi:hypothetical protein
MDRLEPRSEIPREAVPPLDGGVDSPRHEVRPAASVVPLAVDGDWDPLGAKSSRQSAFCRLPRSICHTFLTVASQTEGPL